VTLTAILLSLMLSPRSEATAVPPELAANTLRGLLLFERGQEVVAATPAVANPAAIHLAGQAIKQMLVAQIRTRVIGVVLALTLPVGGLGIWQVLAHRADPANPSSFAPPANETPAPREAAARAKCKNNLKQIGLAAVQFHDTNNVLPYAYGNGPQINSD